MKSNELLKPRVAAALAVEAVLADGESLDEAHNRLLQRLADPGSRALTQALAYNALRHGVAGEALLKVLTRPDLEARVGSLLLVGLGELRRMATAQHAAVNETVEASTLLGRPQARGLVNAVLRRYLREQEELEAGLAADPAVAAGLPGWLYRRIRDAWGERADRLIAASLEQAPMWLRISRQRTDTASYLARLADAGIEASASPAVDGAIRLARGVDVAQLPGFVSGDVSVQDLSAQLAARLLAPQAGERVLDACAAPGGKTAALLDAGADPALTIAADSNKLRLDLLKRNLVRLGQRVGLVTGDLSDPALVRKLPEFDAVLLDAPCTATGVIRRHPDILWLRRETDLAATTALQARLLETLWSRIKPGGRLLYATCSVLPEENSQQIAAFLGRHPEADLAPWTGPEIGVDAGPGRQILTGEQDADGFYYALLTRRPA
ncbi:MAG: 16S rRNA (cytosine(967)-C(5))-methyltransferase RsmB [Xanthomonadales bacterium]|jgi:16S rRNA (cytosine967-C5)-methyltransferase|nr:16S rRNA (cytosine(967)-C(5))-methyltransferase RsmB [Xanthomonadales bacterium]